MEMIKVWVLSGSVIVMGGILIFISKWFFIQAITILKDIREELKGLTTVTSNQDIKITNIEKESAQTHERLNRHSNRIMDVEKHLIILSDKIKE